MQNDTLVRHKVLKSKSELAEGRVMTVMAGHTGICLTHFEGRLNALDNTCPHQGPALLEIKTDVGLI